MWALARGVSLPRQPACSRNQRSGQALPAPAIMASRAVSGSTSSGTASPTPSIRQDAPADRLAGVGGASAAIKKV
jgi:hypothetical protein